MRKFENASMHYTVVLGDDATEDEVKELEQIAMCCHGFHSPPVPPYCRRFVFRGRDAAQRFLLIISTKEEVKG